MPRLLASLVTLLSFTCAPAAPWQPDNGDGTFTNPILWGDYPDPDPIRVGDTYYMISTSMHLMPGCPILRSTDLVNWEFAAYALPEFRESPLYSLEGGSRYGKGSWANSLRFHEGTYYVLFNTNDHKSYIATAPAITGPWTLTKLNVRLHDPGLLFADGKIYVAHGHTKLLVSELAPDARSVATEPREVFHNPEWKALEGSHFYKINNRYYILCVFGGYAGKQVCLRADSPYGPYESKIIIDDDANFAGAGLHQGGLVQTQTGEWWFPIMQDRDATGRGVSLQSVTWIDGWPMLGVDGRGVVTNTRPNTGTARLQPGPTPATSDDFAAPHLALQWQWNHNPENARWSLTERPGHLRLKTAPATSLQDARNTLTQRLVGPYCEATTELDASGLRDGDTAGLGILQFADATLAAEKRDGQLRLVMRNQNHPIATTEPLTQNTLWLRAHADCLTDLATFAYSLDGKTFTPLGNSLKMKFSLKHFVGNRFALFAYHSSPNPASDATGHADFNQVLITPDNHAGNLFSATDRIEAERYDAVSPRGPRPKRSPTGWQTMTDWRDGEWLRFNRIDFGPTPPSRLELTFASTGEKTGTLELRLDSPDGPKLAELPLPAPSPVLTVPLTSAAKLTGIRQIYFVQRGTSDLAFDAFRFEP